MVGNITSRKRHIITDTEDLGCCVGPVNQNDRDGEKSSFKRWLKIKWNRTDED